MSNGKLEEYFHTEYAHSWNQINDFHEAHSVAEAQWVFRGQGSSKWGLESTLEREIASFGLDQGTAPQIERGLLRKFKRQCCHYIAHLPKEKDYLEWLALMRHYGAPTRLLDWTYSFFVALYFAIESANECGCAVWAFSTKWMQQQFGSVLTQYPDALRRWKCDSSILRPVTFSNLFMRESSIPLVGAVTPRRLNERMVIQQGVFLCPGDVSKRFADNFIALLSKSKAESKANLVELIIDVDLGTKKDVLLRLQRMNMNHATLFPGLEGFARSLRTLMIKPEIFLDPGNEGI